MNSICPPFRLWRRAARSVSVAGAAALVAAPLQAQRAAPRPTVIKGDAETPDYVIPRETLLIENPIALTSYTGDKTEAGNFVNFLTSPAGQRIFVFHVHLVIDDSNDLSANQRRGCRIDKADDIAFLEVRDDHAPHRRQVLRRQNIFNHAHIHIRVLRLVSRANPLDIGNGA